MLLNLVPSFLAGLTVALAIPILVIAFTAIVIVGVTNATNNTEQSHLNTGGARCEPIPPSPKSDKMSEALAFLPLCSILLGLGCPKISAKFPSAIALHRIRGRTIPHPGYRKRRRNFRAPLPARYSQVNTLEGRSRCGQ